MPTLNLMPGVGTEVQGSRGTEEQETVSCVVPLRLSRAGLRSNNGGGEEGRREYAVTFIRAGLVRRRDGQDSNWRITPEALQTALPLLREGVACFVDHADGGFWGTGSPSVRDLAGVTFAPAYNHQAESIEGGLRLYDRPDLEWLCMLLDQVLVDQDAGLEIPDLGLSFSFFHRYDIIDVGEDPGEEFEVVTREFTYIESVDIMFGPGAEGRFREILSSVGSDVVLPAWLQRGVMPQEVVVDEVEETGNEGTEEQVAAPDVEVVAAVPAPAPVPGPKRTLGVKRTVVPM